MEHLTYEELYDYIHTEDYSLQERCEEHLMECGQCMLKLQKLTKRSQELAMLGPAIEALNHRPELTKAYQSLRALAGQTSPSLRERLLKLAAGGRNTFQVLMNSNRFQGITGILMDSFNEITAWGRMQPQLLTATRGTQTGKVKVASSLTSLEVEETYINVDGQNHQMLLSFPKMKEEVEDVPLGMLVSSDWRKDAVMKEAKWNPETSRYQILFEQLDQGEYQFFLL